jgi:hypothetical protein
MNLYPHPHRVLSLPTRRPRIIYGLSRKKAPRLLPPYRGGIFNKRGSFHPLLNSVHLSPLLSEDTINLREIFCNSGILRSIKLFFSWSASVINP